MGLSITVGLLDDQARNDAEGLVHFRGAFARLSAALADGGVDWHEPEIADPPAAPAVSAHFPYSYLYHLRRVFVLAGRGERLTPALETDAEQYERDGRKIQDETSMFASHLLCHADNSGYYIPVDFDDPLFLPEESDVAGYGMVGSSQRLLAELASLAPSLGIHLDADGTLPAAEDSTLADLEPGSPFETEKIAWHQLYRACRASIADGKAIVFL
ncbi:hypothetical protein ACFV4G_34315 [Kitasatospora sp. NPDC059747]|uniref:hypothetical protein n=1 Tax=Kitasatospora sp. NPDC059747 TaxID=3346930 RepID=UPI0036547BB6